MLNLNTLNPEQRAAVESLKGPVLILAGAGTGKTRVITFRIAHLVERGVRPDNILAVTFTNKAAREMQARVTKLLPKPAKPADGSKPPRPTICTFHSLCVRILRQHIERLGYKTNFVIYDESEQLGAVRKILSQFNAKGEKTDPKVILAAISRWKSGLANNRPQDVETAVLAEHLVKRYDSALHACNAVDFDDLLILTIRLFKEHPDVLDACRARFRFVMVDEYQDTNAAQFQLVQALTAVSRNLCVVGDDDQSIYGWRGAEIANLLNLEQHYPEVRVVKLEQNYRSTNAILRAANAVIRNNAQRRGKTLWSDQGEGERIVLHTHQTDEEEARSLAERIEFMRLAKRIPWKDQAVLFRTNLQSRSLEVALRQAQIRYHLIGGQSYFDRREIRDVLAYLKTFVNPHDDISLLRIANVPARGLSDVTMERLLGASQERKCSVFAVMRHTDVLEQFPPRTREAITGLVRFIEENHAPLTTKEAFALLPWAEAWLAATGYIEDLRRSEKNPETADNRVRNIKDLLADLDGKPPVPKPKPMDRLGDFLEQLSLDQDRSDDEEQAGDAVTLITMHSCKGLEFPHVHIVGLEDGLLPHTRSKVEGTLDEERRLFYVAITRAQKSLQISYSLGRKRYGEISPCHPSPFLQEIPAELMVDATVTGKQPVKADDGRNMFAALRDAIG